MLRNKYQSTGLLACRNIRLQPVWSTNKNKAGTLLPGSAPSISKMDATMVGKRASALQADGWYLGSDIIRRKPEPKNDKNNNNINNGGVMHARTCRRPLRIRYPV
jgi:hypothetical protein